MKKDKNEILKELSKRVKRMKEKEVDRIVTEIDTIKDDAKMYEAVCILNKKPPENSYVHDKHRRCVSNIQSMNEIINGHFKEHFQKDNVESVVPFKEETLKKVKNH